MMRDNYANESEQRHEKYDEELVRMFSTFSSFNFERDFQDFSKSVT